MKKKNKILSFVLGSTVLISLTNPILMKQKNDNDQIISYTDDNQSLNERSSYYNGVDNFMSAEQYSFWTYGNTVHYETFGDAGYGNTLGKHYSYDFDFSVLNDEGTYGVILDSKNNVGEINTYNKVSLSKPWETKYFEKIVFADFNNTASIFIFSSQYEGEMLWIQTEKSYLNTNNSSEGEITGANVKVYESSYENLQGYTSDQISDVHFEITPYYWSSLYGKYLEDSTINTISGSELTMFISYDDGSVVANRQSTDSTAPGVVPTHLNSFENKSAVNEGNQYEMNDAIEEFISKREEVSNSDLSVKKIGSTYNQQNQFMYDNSSSNVFERVGNSKNIIWYVTLSDGSFTTLGNSCLFKDDANYSNNQILDGSLNFDGKTYEYGFNSLKRNELKENDGLEDLIVNLDYFYETNGNDPIFNNEDRQYSIFIPDESISKSDFDSLGISFDEFIYKLITNDHSIDGILSVNDDGVTAADPVVVYSSTYNYSYFISSGLTPENGKRISFGDTDLDGLPDFEYLWNSIIKAFDYRDENIKIVLMDQFIKQNFEPLDKSDSSTLENVSDTVMNNKYFEDYTSKNDDGTFHEGSSNDKTDGHLMLKEDGQFVYKYTDKATETTHYERSNNSYNSNINYPANGEALNIDVSEIGSDYIEFAISSNIGPLLDLNNYDNFYLISNNVSYLLNFDGFEDGKYFFKLNGLTSNTSYDLTGIQIAADLNSNSSTSDAEDIIWETNFDLSLTTNFDKFGIVSNETNVVQPSGSSNDVTIELKVDENNKGSYNEINKEDIWVEITMVNSNDESLVWASNGSTNKKATLNFDGYNISIKLEGLEESTIYKVTKLEFKTFSSLNNVSKESQFEQVLNETTDGSLLLIDSIKTISLGVPMWVFITILIVIFIIMILILLFLIRYLNKRNLKIEEEFKELLKDISMGNKSEVKINYDNNSKELSAIDEVLNNEK